MTIFQALELLPFTAALFMCGLAALCAVSPARYAARFEAGAFTLAAFLLAFMGGQAVASIF